MAWIKFAIKDVVVTFSYSNHLHQSTARNCVYTALLESFMRSISVHAFGMPEVTVECRVFDCIILAIYRHSGYIVTGPCKKSKNKDKRNKHRVALQAKIVA